jgi:hypothetical protein
MKDRVLVGIIVVSLIIGAGTLRRGHDWGDDFAWYIVQARSILNGTTEEFMRQSEFTNTRSTTHVGPLAYPWGYPLILVPVYAIKGISPLGLKLPGLVFYAGFLICLYYLTKSRITRTESLLIVSLFAFNPMLIEFEDQILSDIPFLFFSTLTLLLMTQDKRRGAVQYALIGVSIFLTTFMRATGILLLGSFLIVEFFRFLKNIKDREAVRQIILDNFILCLAFVVLFSINVVLFPGGGESYLSQYAGLTVELVREFAVLYFNIFSWFFGVSQGWRYLYYLLFVFFLVGAWVRRRDETVFIVFTVLWMVVHITYPYWQGPRYIFPVLPIFIYFTFHGIKTVVARLPERYRFVADRMHLVFWSVIAVILLFNSGAIAVVNLQSGRSINGPFDSYSMEVYEYINEKTPPDSVIVFFKPRVMVLMTGHDTIMSMECDRILLGDYLVLNRKVEENQQIPPGEIGNCNLPLEDVLRNRRFIVYKVLK